MRVLVCGGRDYNDYDRVVSELDDIAMEYSIYHKPDTLENWLPTDITIIHGGATGADTLADVWATHNYCPVEVYKADWKQYGKSAGHIRNKEMLDKGKPDVVIAFPGGRGTANMIEQATKAGVKVIVVPVSSS